MGCLIVDRQRDDRDIYLGEPIQRPLERAQLGVAYGTTIPCRTPHRPPNDLDRLCAWIACFAPPDVHKAIMAAEPAGRVATYRYVTDQRRRYERMRPPPGELLAIGDALCSFSPVYAQGMTVAPQQAAALRSCLAAPGLGAGAQPLCRPRPGHRRAGRRGNTPV